MSEKALRERDRVTRIEAVLDAHDARMQSHMDDCLKIREETKNVIARLGDAIENNHEEWRQIVRGQHADNVKRLRWQNGLLITMVLGIGGFIAEQMWARVFMH